MKNVEVAVLDRVALCLHSERDPTDAEWDAMVEKLERERRSFDTVVAVTLGGTPSARQRKIIRDVLQNVRTVVVTDSSMARGAVTALSWIGVSIEAAPLTELRAVFEKLGPPEVVQRLLDTTRAALDRLSPGRGPRIAR